MNETIRYLTADSDHPFSVEMAGISYCDGSYHIYREKSSIWVFEYVISGRGTVREQDEKFVAQSGDVYILHKDREHDYISDPHNPWVKIWFNIKGPAVAGLVTAYGLDKINHLPDCPPGIEKLYRDFLAATYSQESLQLIFDRCSLIFHEILHKLRSHHPHRLVPGEAESLHNHIMRSLAVPITLDDMAASIFRSKAYAIKLFRAAYGQTPYAYLVCRRLEAAGKLLRETRMPVAEIAEQFCFADQHYFANVFRRHTGLSPRAFRNQAVKKTD